MRFGQNRLVKILVVFFIEPEFQQMILKLIIYKLQRSKVWNNMYFETLQILAYTILVQFLNLDIVKTGVDIFRVHG